MLYGKEIFCCKATKNVPYGLGVVCVNDETEFEEMLKNDPAGKINYFETASIVEELSI